MKTSYKLGIVPARLDDILPSKTFWALVEALKYFDKVMPDFMKSGVLVGAETRISSPVRFVRNLETFQSSIDNLVLFKLHSGHQVFPYLILSRQASHLCPFSHCHFNFEWLLIYFFEMACALSGYTLGVNPFDQPGVEAYKKNMFALLGKPGFEEETKKMNGFL